MELRVSSLIASDIFCNEYLLFRNMVFHLSWTSKFIPRYLVVILVWSSGFIDYQESKRCYNYAWRVTGVKYKIRSMIPCGTSALLFKTSLLVFLWTFTKILIYRFGRISDNYWISSSCQTFSKAWTTSKNKTEHIFFSFSASSIISVTLQSWLRVDYLFQKSNRYLVFRY